MEILNFGERIVLLRKENNLSQSDLAEKCGVTRQAVAKWENGKGFPDIFRIIDIADIFEVDVNDLLPANKNHKEKYDYLVDMLFDNCFTVIYANLDTGDIYFKIVGRTLDGVWLGKSQFNEIKNYYSDEIEKFNRRFVYSDDYETIKKDISKDNIKKKLIRHKEYTINYRLLVNGEIIYTKTTFKRSMNFNKTHNFICQVQDITDEQVENIRKQNIINMLCKNFSALYYLDFERDEFSYIRLNEFLKEFANQNPLWFKNIESAYDYAKAYADTFVCPEYRDEFIRIVNPHFLRTALKNNDYYIFLYEGERDRKRRFFKMKVTRSDKDVTKILAWFEEVDEKI